VEAAAKLEVEKERMRTPVAVPQEEEPDELPIPGKEAEVLPVSHEVAIKAHERAVTALGLDPKGSRMVTGSMDGTIKFYDFNGMSEEKNSFRSLEPVEGHMVQAISFGTTGGQLLVICSDSHARIYDREGSSKPIQMSVLGDMYVRDMTQTKGHTQMLTSGQWHPFANENFITSSLDGTIRIWDMNAPPVGMDQRLPSVHVLKILDKRNVCVGGGSGKLGGCHPCCCTYSPADAKKIAGGCSDGSVQIFFDKQRYQKPDRILRQAHTAAVTDVTFLCEGGNDSLMVTRSLDSTMKVWDCRMLSDAKGPVKVFENLSNNSEKGSACTSSDGRYIATGTTIHKGAFGTATVRVFDAKDFSLVKSLDFGQRSALRLAWPKDLNQLVVGTGTGEVVMLYSPFSSKKGALHFVGRKAKTKSAMALEHTAGDGPVFNMTDKDDIQRFYQTGHGNMARIRKIEARQAQKTITPVRPPANDGATGALSDTAAFAAMALKAGAKRLNLQNASGQEKDAQKALLKYADKGSVKEGTLVDNAYKGTQPEKILDWSVDESEGDKRMQTSADGNFCRKCGQKVCRCMDYSTWGQKRPRTG